VQNLVENLEDGPWYIHLWELGKNTITVVFKDKVFTVTRSKDTWREAVLYGKSLGIPEEQLDFPTE
jgi:hypothetical protein